MLMQTVPYFGVASCNKSNFISRVMKGYFNIKPVQYKPKTTGDVSKVLNYISSLYPLQSLCLKLSTFKLITLVALTTAARVPEQKLCQHSTCVLCLSIMTKYVLIHVHC
jgi:hypothetical protein